MMATAFQRTWPYISFAHASIAERIGSHCGVDLCLTNQIAAMLAGAWLTGMKHAVALLAFLVANVCASRTAVLSNQVLNGYIEDLTRGLPDEDTIKRVNSLLAKLKPEKVKMLHSACCKGGECAEGAAAFLVEQCPSFAEGVKVDECAWQLPSYFTTYARSREDVPDALKYPAVTPSDAAFIKGLGLWYLDTGCNADIKESLKEALSYVILSDGSAENSEIRAKIVLESTEKKDSKVLQEYWKAQDASRQLAVYRNLRTGGYSDLGALQPDIFNMDCIQSRTCSDEDYAETFRAHLAPLDDERHALYHLIVRLRNRPFSQFADALRKVTGVATVEGLGEGAHTLLQLLTEAWELPKDLAFKVAISGPDFPLGDADHLILDANKIATLETLDHQILDLITDRESLLGSKPFFPHSKMDEYIPKRYNGLRQYRELYLRIAQNFVEKVLRVSLQDWVTVEPSPTENFDEAAFWKLVEFLGTQDQRYWGLFGQLVLVQHKFPKEFGELVPGGLKALMQKVTENTDEAQLHEDLDNIALRVFELRLPDHPFFKKQFETVRQQLKRGLFEAFEAQDVPVLLNEHIMNAQAETGGSDELYELQVDVMARIFYILRGDPTRDSEEWKPILTRYSSQQLRNIYKSDSPVPIVLNHAQLREKFDFATLVKYPQISRELSKLYQRAFPQRESVLGQRLKHLDTDFAETRLTHFELLLFGIIIALPENQDFSIAGDKSPWPIVDKSWYKAMDRDSRLNMMRHLYPELANVQPDDAAVDQCETFDELLKLMTPNNDTK